MKTLLLCLASLYLTGCATIVGEKTKLVTMTSNPSDAVVVVTEENNMEIFKGKTPTQTVLRKSSGEYFGGKEYKVKITKEGYDEEIIHIGTDPNAWYLFGNIVFGGLIGWFIVDPQSGAMYDLNPNQIQPNLIKSNASDAQVDEDEEDEEVDELEEENAELNT